MQAAKAGWEFGGQLTQFGESIASRQVAADPNVPGFLQTLSARGIIPPAVNDHWPAREYLAEHRKTWRL